MIPIRLLCFSRANIACAAIVVFPAPGGPWIQRVERLSAAIAVMVASIRSAPVGMTGPPLCPVIRGGRRKRKSSSAGESCCVSRHSVAVSVIELAMTSARTYSSGMRESRSDGAPPGSCFSFVGQHEQQFGLHAAQNTPASATGLALAPSARAGLVYRIQFVECPRKGWQHLAKLSRRQPRQGHKFPRILSHYFVVHPPRIQPYFR